MESGGGGGCGGAKRWGFRPNAAAASAATWSVRGTLNKIRAAVPAGDARVAIPLGNGDPSLFASFRTPAAAEDAVVAAVRSAQFNCYAPAVGIPSARSAIAEYLSRDLPYKLSSDDIFVTGGCTQAVDAVFSILARPGVNILLPMPGFPLYEARSVFSGIDVRYFDLIPEKGWEIDLEAVEALADENTAAMVIINPNNPCGNVFTYQHLAKVAETASKLGIMVIADEVYDHLVFGSNPFVPMGVFGETVPVVTLGSISKRWVVPGWRLGWVAICDPKGILRETKVVDSIASYLNISTDPATFIQGAIPHILENTKEDFFNKIIALLRETADICYNAIKEIECITCPHKPEGSMFVMVKLNISCLEHIHDDVDFCKKLAEEESVIILPGSALGMKNWLRITFAIDPSSLVDGLGRLKSFCRRNAKLRN
ncbi:nicotianamine aminotransferase A-like [Ananas comosus]|uniref:nicotianamine aminotransferase n=1 Tax=Ananas comosus TaxID=4615 RepID=A0A6P5FL00_ANACO|nr:nicotianamine aminotransferase A-like [Ananas comosus]